jgi:tRNA pseudouridine38-40 synthase
LEVRDSTFPTSNIQPPTSSTRTLQLTIEYDGTDFRGFQRLSAGRTVQGTLEAAWQGVTGESVRTVGAGRTDAGVHARAQVVSLRTQAGIPADRAAAALNGRLPADIRVRRARERDATFHARFTATGRTYRYLIRRGGGASVFKDRYSLLVTDPLDVPAMREAAEPLLGSHDFRAFGSADRGRTAVRRMRRITFRETGGWLVVSLTANAFLQGMARCLVAQFLAVGRGVVTPIEMYSRLAARDRNAAGKGAPPNGLYLAHVEYDNLSIGQ